MPKAFDKYEGASLVPDVRRMPKSEIKTNTAPRTVHELMARLEDATKNPEVLRARYPWADRFVLGYPLPSWQRPPVWSLDQKVRFITSMWLDVDVGSYLVNDVVRFEQVDGKEVDVLSEFSDVLLDGQQRLTAIEEYFLGVFPVPDQDSVPVFWQDLCTVERRFFGNKCFSRSIVHCWDETELRRIYDLRSFGGTAHTEDQRALKAKS